MEDLKDFVLENIKFEANGREYSLRPLSLRDQGRFQELFGMNWLSVLDEGNVDAVCKIAYVLLADDKSEYKLRKEEEIDLDGKVVKRTVGGWQLFAREFVGDAAGAALVNALRDAISAGSAESDDDESVEGDGESQGK